MARVPVNPAVPSRPAAPPAQQRAAQIRHDLVNEQVLIVAAASDKQTRAWLVRRALPEHFYGQGHADIWRGLIELDKRALEYSGPALRQVSGGAANDAYVDKLLGAYKSVPPNLSHHLDALAWDKVRRDAAEGPVLNLVQLLQDPATSPDAMRAVARQVANTFDQGSGGSLRYLRDPSELVRQQTAVVASRTAGHALYPFGIEGLDFDLATNQPRLVPGCEPGLITLVSGTSGSGKTVLAARMVLGLIEQGRRVLYGAWEVGSGMTLEILAAMRMGLSRTRLMTGQLTAEERAIHAEQMDIIAGWVRFMEIPFGRERGKAKITNDHALDVLHRYMDESGCDVAVYDMLKRAFRQTDPDEEENALYRMQAIALETRVHVVEVHQQRMKDIEGRPDKRPTREGAKGTSAWVECADNMLGIHRPALWKRVDDITAEILILKQRFGRWPLAVEFDWSGEHGSLDNGRTIAYEPPGNESSSADPLGELAEPKRGRGGWRGRE